MDKIVKALGCQIDWDPRPYGRHNTITLDEISAIAKLAREAQTLDGVVEQLTAGYTVGNLRRAVDQLEQAITNLRAAPGQQMELTS
jgi:hypothetical protein